MTNSNFSYINGLLDITESVKFYHIEMQRYLKSVAEVIITLDRANPRKYWYITLAFIPNSTLKRSVSIEWKVILKM